MTGRLMTAEQPVVEDDSNYLGHARSIRVTATAAELVSHT
jgi:hypothetical protein